MGGGSREKPNDNGILFKRMGFSHRGGRINGIRPKQHALSAGTPRQISDTFSGNAKRTPSAGIAWSGDV